jgi:aminopeptidase N
LTSTSSGAGGDAGDRHAARAAQSRWQREGTIRLNGDGLTPLVVKVDEVVRNDWRLEGEDLVIDLPDDSHEISIVTQIIRRRIPSLGLYASGGMLCTQCEAEGFRRITFFPDRPDVLSVYACGSGRQGAFPVLLSNGNCLASGECGRARIGRVARSLAQAFVPLRAGGGRSGGHRDRFTTMSGREVALNIWTRAGMRPARPMPCAA